MVNNTFHLHVWFKNSGDVFVHNIIMRKYAPIQMKYWGQKIDSNLFPDKEALKIAYENGTDSNSMAGSPMFINPAKGDFRVKANSPALKIGFKNFPMNQFGVQKPSLKKIALKPEMPVSILEKTRENKGGTRNFLGGVIKSVEGFGESSAYGLADESGVIVIDTGGGLLAKSGLKQKDVIRAVNDKRVKNVKELLDIYNSLKNFNTVLPLSVMRDQQVVRINLKTK